VRQLALPGTFNAAQVACPHPERRRHAVIQAQGWRQPFDACIPCKQMFAALIEGWERGELTPIKVVRTMKKAGYTNLDGARFAVELILTKPRGVLAMRRA
jgi:hypothetical protein